MRGEAVTLCRGGTAQLPQLPAGPGQVKDQLPKQCLGQETAMAKTTAMHPLTLQLSTGDSGDFASSRNPEPSECNRCFTPFNVACQGDKSGSGDPAEASSLDSAPGDGASRSAVGGAGCEASCVAAPMTTTNENHLSVFGTGPANLQSHTFAATWGRIKNPLRELLPPHRENQITQLPPRRKGPRPKAAFDCSLKGKEGAKEGSVLGTTKSNAADTKPLEGDRRMPSLSPAESVCSCCSGALGLGEEQRSSHCFTGATDSALVAGNGTSQPMSADAVESRRGNLAGIQMQPELSGGTEGAIGVNGCSMQRDDPQKPRIDHEGLGKQAGWAFPSPNTSGKIPFAHLDVPVADYLHYLQSRGNTPTLFDVVYAYERHRDGLIAKTIVQRWKRRLALSPEPPSPRHDFLGSRNAVASRAAVVDKILQVAAELRESMYRHPSDISRATIQLAISLFDRAHCFDALPTNSLAIRACASFCLLTAMQFETPNSHSIEPRLRKHIQLDRMVEQAFKVPFSLFQQYVLNCVDLCVSVPIGVDFANYFLHIFDDPRGQGGASSGNASEGCGGKRDVDRGSYCDSPTSHRFFPSSESFATSPDAMNSPEVQLICFLLDCFALTADAAVTPASLAAAAAVQLAKRIHYPALPSCDLWSQHMQRTTGYGRQEVRHVLKTMNNFLTMNNAGKYTGLFRLHQKGWGSMVWETPSRS